jgi:transposase-like protein
MPRLSAFQITGEGRQRANRRGMKLGRRRSSLPEQRREAIKWHDEGEETRAEIARRYNVHPSTISRLRV